VNLATSYPTPQGACADFQRGTGFCATRASSDGLVDQGNCGVWLLKVRSATSARWKATCSTNAD
jgi:hypothetical protein